MPTNQIKVYSDLLELVHLSGAQRQASLQGIFKRDIEENSKFVFRGKNIRPVKGEEPSMQILFRHLTTEEIEETNPDGSTYPKRVFEMDRSVRLHWVKCHIEESISDHIAVFSALERDQRKRKDVIRTYLYNIKQKYVVVLEPQRSNQDYYLLTAYHLNKAYGSKKMDKLLKKKLPDIH